MPFELGTLTYPMRPPELSMLVVAKATFDLVHEANAKIARSQQPLTGDTYFDDEADGSPVYPSDFALLKQRGECFLLGSCRPPGNRATVSVAAFQVGVIQKAIGVFGDRQWKRRLLVLTATDPEPFEAMPLRWDRAYGGPKVPANPVGRGVEKRVDADGKDFRPLPNLESVAHPIGGPDDAPEPVGFGPIAAHWAERRKHAGTYGDRWLRQRAPWLPDDIHPSFFNQAPLDQRVRSHWAGNEDIVLKNVSPERPILRSRLPGLRVRAFVESTPQKGARLTELKMTLDTIVVDGEAGQALCVWRGLVPVADERASDVARLFAFHEPFDVQTSFDACRDRLNANLLLMQLEAAGFRPRNPQEDIDAGTVALTRFAKRQELGGDGTIEGATMALTGVLVRDSGTGASGSTIVLAAPGDAPPMDAPADAGAHTDAAVAEGEPRTASADEAEADRAWVELEEKLAELNPPASGPPPFPPSATELAAALAAAKEQGVDLDFMESVHAEQIDVAGAGAPAAQDERLAAPPADPRQRVIDAHAAGRPIEGDFEGVDLSGLDLAGLQANGAHLARASFSGANLSGASFDDAILFDANLDRATLSSASLKRADLSRASLVGVVANGAVLDEAILADAVLTQANLVDASLRAALLRNANLAEVIAHRVVLDEADLTGAQLANAKMQQASLNDAAIHAAYAARIDLRGAKLVDLRADGANLREADLRETNAKGAVLRGSDLTAVRLSFSKLDTVDFTGCVMTRAKLGGCSAKSTLFVEAKLDHAELMRSDLSHASFIGADLENADLRGSCLYGAQAWNAKTSGLKLAEALVEGSSFAPR